MDGFDVLLDRWLWVAGLSLTALAAEAVLRVVFAEDAE
jgi:hypothetical protein